MRNKRKVLVQVRPARPRHVWWPRFGNRHYKWATLHYVRGEIGGYAMRDEPDFAMPATQAVPALRLWRRENEGAWAHRLIAIAGA